MSFRIFPHPSQDGNREGKGWEVVHMAFTYTVIKSIGCLIGQLNQLVLLFLSFQILTGGGAEGRSRTKQVYMYAYFRQI
jgi:hypothetical protein